MAQQLLVNRVRTYSSGTPGRSLNQVGSHHFVIDEPPHAGGPGQEITPADAFLAGVSACGLLLVETFAREEGVDLRRTEVNIEGARSPSDTSRFTGVSMRFELHGPSQRQAEHLVERYKSK
ncbi:MAG: OsmC family protein [Chloroflexi bacterium]|nr:OsmC family protein [Chloroflexota bacterium]